MGRVFGRRFTISSFTLSTYWVCGPSTCQLFWVTEGTVEGRIQRADRHQKDDRRDSLFLCL
jgi:hypothetical protein